MVVNAIDLTDDAKSRFESKLKGLVGVDDNPKELKYKPCDEAQREPPPTPPLPIAIATELPSVSTHDGGVVLFGDAAPLPHSEGGSAAPAAPAIGSDPPQGAGGEKRASSDTDGPDVQPPKKVHPPIATTPLSTLRPSLAPEALTPLQARRRNKTKQPLKEISAYEMQRQNNINANNAQLASLGLSPLIKKKEPTQAQLDRKRASFEKRLVKEALLDDAKDLATSITKGTVHVPVRCCSVLTLLL